MANCYHLFKKFDGEIQITSSKRENLKTSKDNLRDKIRKYFKDNHPGYSPTFYIQGSRKMKTTIRTKDDTCDLDDGVYFKENKENVTGTTLQKWVKDAVDGVTEATPSHRKKCITIDYKAGYNIDLPVFIFDEETDEHPKLAVKNEDFKIDDPKEFVDEFNKRKDSDGQLLRIVRYLKVWSNYNGTQMPSGLALTILAMDNFYKNDRDDISLKYTLIEIEKQLKKPYNFKCIMQTTPFDNIFQDYSSEKEEFFMNKLSDFITDAKQAVDVETNILKASKLWKKHLGDRFPEGEDKEEEKKSSSNFSNTISTAKPYYATR